MIFCARRQVNCSAELFHTKQTNHRRPVEGAVSIGQSADSNNRRESTKSVSFQERYETPYKMMARDELDDDELRRKVRWNSSSHSFKVYRKIFLSTLTFWRNFKVNPRDAAEFSETAYCHHQLKNESINLCFSVKKYLNFSKYCQCRTTWLKTRQSSLSDFSSCLAYLASVMYHISITKSLWKIR